MDIRYSTGVMRIGFIGGLSRSGLCSALALVGTLLVSASARADEADLAGYRDGFFYLRDKSGDFVLYPQLRGQIDAYNYAGQGVADTTLKSTVLLRRVRPELAGELLGHWQFLIAGDWGQTGLDNPRGTNETSASPPGAAPTAATARYSSAQSASVRAAPADVYINYRADELLNVQVGQYNPPFTLEGTASEKTMPFLERNMGSRLLANPQTKDIGLMVWGSMHGERLHYALGVFNGDGQNRQNPDNRYDAIGRALVKPLHGLVSGSLAQAHVGASFRYGSRDPNYVSYDATTLTTTGNYAFWSPVYQSSKGYTHVIPSSTQLGLAGELRVPFSLFALTSEVVWIDYRTREAVEGYEATNTERAGQIRGYSYYVQLSAWLFGPRDVIGNRLTNPPPHVDFGAPAKVDMSQALQAIVRFEQLHLTYDSASRHGVADAKNIDGDIKVNVLSTIATWWATRHVRLSAQYGLNMFPGSEPVKASSPGGPTQTSSQRALAPAQNLAAGINDGARDGGHVLHEILFRAAIAL